MIGASLALLLCGIMPATFAVVPINDCFKEPVFSLAFPAGGLRNTIELVLLEDALNASSCPLTSRNQLASIEVRSGSRIALNVQVEVSTLGLTITLTTPVLPGHNILEVIHTASAGPLFSATVYFYDVFHLDQASLLDDGGVLSLVGHGRAFPVLPKRPALRLRVRSSKMEHDLTQWQLVCLSANATTVSRGLFVPGLHSWT